MHLKIGNPMKYFNRMLKELNEIKKFLQEKERYFKSGNYKVVNFGKTIAYTGTLGNEFLRNNLKKILALLVESNF